MTYLEEERFLHSIVSTLEVHPELLQKTLFAITTGIEQHIKKLNNRVADFETIAAGFMSLSTGKNSKKNAIWAENLILSKLKKHKDYSFINWTENIAELEQRIKGE